MPDAPVGPPPASRFSACLDVVLEQEGGYVDNPLDPGGATNLGITRRTLAAWRKISPWWQLPKSEVRALGKSEAAAIYKSAYWDRCAADALPAGLDLALFDFAVNSGPDRAIKTLQVELGVKPDGIVGPLTLAAISGSIARGNVAALIDALCNQRLTFLSCLTASPTFGIGWARRVAEIRAAAFAMAGVAEPFPQPQKDISPMNLNFLAGYKTYLVGFAMLLLGAAQLLGATIPDFSGQSAGDLLMQGLGIIFLRHAIANTVAKS